MTLSDGFFQLADQRLAYLAKREAVLSQNIANASTPGWRSRDLKPFSDFMKNISVEPVSTNPMHLAGVPTSVTSVTAKSERAPDGNAVAIDAEMVKIADSDTTHVLITDLYKKYLGLFRTALGR